MSKRRRDSSEDESFDVSCDVIEVSPPASVISSPEGSPIPKRSQRSPVSFHTDSNLASLEGSELFSTGIYDSSVKSAIVSDVHHEPPRNNDAHSVNIADPPADVTVIMNEHELDLGDGDDSVGTGSDSSDCLGASEFSFDEEEDEREMFHPGNPLIYEGAQITVSESMTAILSYLVRHEVSGKQLIDLLDLINLHCREENNKMISSLYLFKKYFSLLDCPVVYHYYCSHCFAKISRKSDECPSQELHPDSKQKCFFVELPLEQQLQDLFLREEFVSNISHRRERKKCNPSNIEDVYDGQLYLELIESGFISDANPYNLTFITNSDGVPVFHSTKDSLWPVFLNVLELPPNLRFKQENTVIAGLWFGAKPSVNLLLTPLLRSFQNIKTGFTVKPHGCDSTKTAKGVVLAATSDLPAKAMLLGMSGHSGSFGCQICKIKGRSVKIVKKIKKSTRGKKSQPSTTSEEVSSSSVWVFPFSDSLDLRNITELLEFGKQAQRVLLSTGKETNIFGVKFPSALLSIMYDALRGFAIDDLHTLYLGVIRTLVNLWFDSKHSSQPFSVRKHMTTVDGRLKILRLPNFLERGVSSLEHDLPFWKGKDYLVWAHYLSIPILENVLPDKYMEHHIDLINCLQLLQSNSIAPESLLNCDKILKKYVQEFENLYGTRHMTMVVHLLLHLVFVVNNLGPLKTLSCFPYESLNGMMLKMIHGTRYVETQLASACYIIRKLPLQLKSTTLNERTSAFCDAILHPSRRLKVLENIDPTIFSVGNYRDISVLPNHVAGAIQDIVDMDQIVSTKSFLKLKKGNMLYVARSYSRCMKTNSSTCSFYDEGLLKYGVIDVFVKITTNEQNLFLAIIDVAEKDIYVVGSKTVSSIWECKLSGCFKAVPVTAIASMVVFVEVDDRTFICEALDHALKS